jgi:hypothetical protein
MLRIDPEIGYVDRHRIVENRWKRFSALTSVGSVVCSILINPWFAALGLISGLAPTVRGFWSSHKETQGYRQPLGDPAPPDDGDTSLHFPCITPTVAAGTVTMDVGEAVGDELFARRVRFGTEDTYRDDITLLNMYGYFDSQYGGLNNPAAYQRKRQRNHAITKINPYAFAALIDAENPDVYLGVTAILPLTDIGYEEYTRPPGMPDNEFKPEWVVAEGLPFRYALVFAIADFKLYRREFPIARLKNGTDQLEPYCSDDKTAEEINKLLNYQLGVLLANGRCNGAIQLLGQSKIGTVQRCYGRFGMTKTDSVKTADGEPVFRCTLLIQNVEEAAAILAKRPKLTGP